MRRQDGWRWAGVLVLLAATWPATAADPPKKDGDKPDDKPAAEKLVSLGQITGVVKSTGGSEKRLVIEVSTQYLEVNPGAEANLVREQEDLLRRQRQILMTRNPVQRQRDMVQLLRDAARMQVNQQNLFRIKEVKKDVEVLPADDLKVRTLNPPLQYDDKGYPKKYTKEELKELKGDSKLPGYNADLDSVQQGQVVVAYLARKKAQKGEKLDNDPGDKPLVTVVVIASDVKK
jgi:hypothetical protein